jgi:uncharacterized membrane protein
MTQAQIVWFHGLSLGVSVVAGIYGYFKVQSSSIAIHFKLDGSPDRFASALAGLFGLPIAGILLLAFSFWSAGHLAGGSQIATNVIPAIVQAVLTAGQIYIVYRALRG